MAFTEHQSIRGALTIVLRDPGGALLLERRVDNLITRDGKMLLAGLLTGKVDTGITLEIAVGRGEAPASESDGALADPADAAPAKIVRVEPFERAGAWQVRAVITATLKADPDAAEVTELREAGVVVRSKVPSEAPVLFNRVVFPVISKGSNVEMTLTWEITL